MNSEIEDALIFYADAATYLSPTKGWNAQYDPEPAPITVDKGERARRVLDAWKAGHYDAPRS